MRIGVVWTAPSRLVDISVRYERYLRGFRALGHDAFAVCSPEAADGFTEPVFTVPHTAAFLDHDFWQSLRLDAAVLVTWLGMPEQVAVLKRACPYVVSIADSDGQVGARVHPGPLFRRMQAMHRGWSLRLRAAKFWLQQLLYLAPREDRPHTDSAERADLIAVCSSGARANLCRFFSHYARPDLCPKVAVIPYPIDACYLQGSVNVEREDRIIAVGRWDDPQKDAPLLCRAVARYLDGGGRTEFAFVGPGGAVFESLTRHYPRVRYLGLQRPEIIADLMRRSRALLLTSVWESGPLVLNEALASGCTTIGLDCLPAVVSACQDGPFGTVARGRSPKALAAAILAEMECWERGERSPAANAAHWRPRFDPLTVARQLLLPVTKDALECLPAGQPSPSCC
jgi:glycosyltransferase involved in cell wall biosynthesis